MAKPKAVSFFDKYAGEYDLMTNAEAREPGHRREIRALIDKFSPTSVLDAGCGTGLTSLLFAEAGVRVAGIDVSAEMVRRSAERCDHLKEFATFTPARFESLPASYKQSFDLIVCLANSLSGVSSATALSRSFRQFHRALRPGGTLVIQLLNAAIFDDGVPFLIKVSRHDQILYHRYALRVRDRIGLHIVRTDLSGEPASFEVFVHGYEPESASRLTARLKAAGFRRVTSYGNLAMTERFRSQSRDLVLVAQRLS